MTSSNGETHSPMTNPSDPIKSQAAIVAAITNNQIQWTVEHRNVLIALKNCAPIPDNIPPSIVEDVHRFLKIWAAGWPKEAEYVARQPK
jgi:hypothetical protein